MRDTPMPETCTRRNDYEYLNTGDAYTPTILADRYAGRFFVSDWGSIVEREGSLESGSISLPLLTFQACAAIGLASALWSVYLRLVAQIGGLGL